jgi:hypothetical protein
MEDGRWKMGDGRWEMEDGSSIENKITEINLRTLAPQDLSPLAPQNLSTSNNINKTFL